MNDRKSDANGRKFDADQGNEAEHKVSGRGEREKELTVNFEMTEPEDTKTLLTRIDGYFDKLTRQMESAQILDYIQMMHKPWRLLFNNLLYGISRGIGIALGFTIFAGTILYFLRILGALNLPIVGNYIAEIVKIVQGELGARNY